MSLLSVVPEAVTTASGDLDELASVVRSANAAAASRTTAIAAPAADEVSTAITAIFGTHAQGFQALGAKASAFHDEFAKLLHGGAAQYLNTEVANAEQSLVNAVSMPAASRAASGLPSSWYTALSTTNHSSYGPGGTQTETTTYYYPNLPNLEPLANAVQSILPASLGSKVSSAITGLSDTPWLTSTTVSGSDTAGNVVGGVSFTTPGGFGIGANGDTGNSNYSANLSVPGFQISSGVTSGGFYGSGYVLGNGAALAYNNGIITGSVQVGAELSDDLNLGTFTGTIQENTTTYNLSSEASLSGGFNAFTGTVLVNPGAGIEAYSQSGWLNSLLVGTSDPVTIPLTPGDPSFLGTYLPSQDPALYLNGLTSGVNFSSLNGGNLLPDNNAFAQWIDSTVVDTNSLVTNPDSPLLVSFANNLNSGLTDFEDSAIDDYYNDWYYPFWTQFGWFDSSGVLHLY